MQQQILMQKQNDNTLIQNKSEYLKQVKALKTAKERERSILYSDFEKIAGDLLLLLFNSHVRSTCIAGFPAIVGILIFLFVCLS